jgi:transcriptional regulator with XRE-family HTH domain
MSRKSIPEARLLRAYRDRQGLTQQALAAMLTEKRGASVYQHQVANWENGAGMSRSTRAFLRGALGGDPRSKAAV